MKGLLRLLYAFVLVGFFGADASADKPKILLLKDFQPGTKAVGFSVFKGFEPQPFNVVLGATIEQSGNRFILANISGGPMETPLEKIGAIAGMSGSPIFIGCTDVLGDCINNGTLVGALSYRIGSFILGGMNCLLTPAEYMLGSNSSGYVAATHFYNESSEKISIGGQEFFNLMLFPKMENLSVAGNQSSQCQESLKSDIKPGSMVSVFLATGTFNLGSSGTVTWRDGDNIYIFGHPFNGSGMVQYPFVQVSVADTVQTPDGAFKLVGCHLNTKGAIFIDGAFEMSGIVGGKASMLPYSVELYMGNGGAILNEQIASSPLAPAIIKQLPLLWAQQYLGDLSRFSLTYQERVVIENKPEIFVKSVIPVRANKNPFGELFSRVYSPLQVMRESGFEHHVESIKVRIEIIKDFKLWTAKKSFLSQEKAIPGETVYVNIVLEEFFTSEAKQISIPIKVPEDFLERTESGTTSDITVFVQSGNRFIDKRGVGDLNSLEELIQSLNQSMNYKTNVLYVQEVMSRPKTEQKTEKDRARSVAKSAWKWADVVEGDLRQFPSGSKNYTSLTLSPPLNGFIDFNATFELKVQPKKDAVAENVKKTKNRKWFLLFIF